MGGGGGGRYNGNHWCQDKSVCVCGGGGGVGAISQETRDSSFNSFWWVQSVHNSFDQFPNQ